MDNFIMLLNSFNDEKDKEEIINELTKIYNYKIDIINKDYSNIKEMDKFIKSVVDKYRYKMEVMDFYNIPRDKEDLDTNRYDLLCLIERMIYNYIVRKMLR